MLCTNECAEGFGGIFEADGYCDDGSYGYDYDCAEFSYDGGDCP